PSTISRELRRNAATRSHTFDYRATAAQWHADRAARRPKTAKLVMNETLRTYVQDRLAGLIAAPGGEVIPGPRVAWKGRRHGPRQHRRWARAWSPEQIAERLPLDFPDDPTMRISHEAIYQALYVQGRGALRRELSACLRTGRALRVPRARTQGRRKSFVSRELLISERPAEAEDRAVPGHWEGDLILGLRSSAIGTLVERTTRFTMLLHLPRMHGHGSREREKNGPALAGHGAEAVRDGIVRAIISLPEHLRRSLTWDQGAELAQHERVRIDGGIDVYFCDPRSPWQRGTNENTNGLLRQYFPKGTDLSTYSNDELDAVALRSTLDHVKRLAGEHRPKHWMNFYARPKQEVLRRPVEPRLRAAIAMVYEPLLARVFPLADRLLQGVQGEVTLQRAGHPPADDPARVHIDHERHVDEAAPGCDVRQVRDPQLVRPLSREVAFDQVQRPRRSAIGDRRQLEAATVMMGPRRDLVVVPF